MPATGSTNDDDGIFDSDEDDIPGSDEEPDTKLKAGGRQRTQKS